MEIKIGDILEEITLPTINGSNFSLSSLKGKKVLLTFYRFARCPMCNLRINEILKRYDELGKNFTMVGIFDSKTLVARFSSLNAIKSSVLPPPLAIIITSINFNSLKFLIDSQILATAFCPLTFVFITNKLTYGDRLFTIFLISLNTEPSLEVIIPIF